MLGVNHGTAPIIERCSITFARGLGLVICLAVPANVVEVRIWTRIRGITRVNRERAANRVDKAVAIDITFITIVRRAPFADRERKVLDKHKRTALGSLPRTHEVLRGLFDRDRPTDWLSG